MGVTVCARTQACLSCFLFPLLPPFVFSFFQSVGVVCVCVCVCVLGCGPAHQSALRLWREQPGPPCGFLPWTFRINQDPDCLGLSARSGSSLKAALKLLLPPPFSRDANQPPASCLVGADSISQGAHLLPGPFIKSAGAAGDLREGGAGKQGRKGKAEE